MRSGGVLMTCSIWLIGLGLLVAVFYYGAILLGFYKDSMMAHFREYGEERRVYPLARFLLALGLFCLVLSPLLPGGMTGLIFTALALIIIVSSYAVTRVEPLQASLPRWYYRLLRELTREERRAIAYAWLRLPLRTRLRLNGDDHAFWIFIDEVRLTVIYGARDPDDPWAAWQ